MQTAKDGIGNLLVFLTLLSANLAVLNFLPIPILDGGHMVFLAWEGIRGKPPDERVQLALTYCGLLLILALMVWVLGLDLRLHPPASRVGSDLLDMSKRSFFDQCALASGLLTAQQLDAARADLGPPTIDGAEPGDPQLAERLVAGGLLNAWQAKQLLDGRTKFTLGPYRIVDSIGQGGMGQVFKAEHALSGRTVAIKVLPRDKSTPEAVANFTREIQALARLDHRQPGPRLGRRPGRQRLLPGHRVRARHRSPQAGPPRRPLEHGTAAQDHLRKWPRASSTPTSKGSSIAT